MGASVVFGFLVTVWFARLHLIDATFCVPNSSFNIDCDTCTCSSNGQEYNCSNNKCPPQHYNEKYDVSVTKDGFKLLVPKDNNDDDFTLKKRMRKTRVPNGFPYLNDEMFIPEKHKSVHNIEDNSIDDNKKKFVDVVAEAVENLDEDEHNENRIDNDEDNENINKGRWKPFVKSFKSRKTPKFPE